MKIGKKKKEKKLLFAFSIRLNYGLRAIAISFKFDVSFEFDVLSKRCLLC